MMLLLTALATGYTDLWHREKALLKRYSTREDAKLMRADREFSAEVMASPFMMDEVAEVGALMLQSR